MTEHELVRAAAHGDEAAFGELVRMYENKAYHLALRMCGNDEDAYDIAQDAFLSAWRGLPSFRGEAGFSTWLYRLVSNAAIDHLRRTKHQRGNVSLDDEELHIDTADTAPGPEESAEGKDLQRVVQEGLNQLGDDHRTVLVMREVQSLSYEEIAHTLAIDLGTVKSRISRARNALRKILLKSGNLSGYLPSNLQNKNERRG
ncbi:MAG: sigma-70 family RNA polymerase sigma factor [Oscillospiraceae bacterium]|nr:sigma-70 family RNA polymerase sigma factor [Oscillospiraceae bacterium]